MVFTPLDIHNKEFRRVFRGYAEDEVDDFLDKIAKEYETLYKENLELKDVLDRKEDNIGKYKDLEDTLKNTLVVAQQTAQDIKTNSQKEAELILQKAKNEAASLYSDAQREAERMIYQAKNQAHDIMFEAQEKVKAITFEYEKLLTEYQKFQINCKAMLLAQLELVQKESSIKGGPFNEIWQGSNHIASTKDVVKDGEEEEGDNEALEYELLRRNYEEENND